LEVISDAAGVKMPTALRVPVKPSFAVRVPVRIGDEGAEGAEH
jgi:hypothetical protein